MKKTPSDNPNIFKKNSWGTVVDKPGRLILFPLCDKRGMVSNALNDSSARFDDYKAENIFFAWLLDLPSGIDAGLAAEALLLVAKDRATGEGGDTNEFRTEMIELLYDVQSRGSVYLPELSVSETMDEL